MKLDISEGAIFQRLKRRLAKDGLVLHAARGRYWSTNLGRYYIVENGRITQTHVNLGKTARVYGLLKAYEQVHNVSEAA
jgi:hypothetical protein